MVEAEIYQEDISSIRLSVRSAPKEGLALGVLNLLKLCLENVTESQP